jgi:arsenate reductase
MTDDAPATPADGIFNVLFLCTHNSARSILAEALLNRLGQGRFRAFSAGSQPRGEPNPHALALLAEKGIDAGFARSKSWDEFARPDAPRMHFVFTVCDDAAGETCPVWPGQPMTAHWGIPDPSAVPGADWQVAAAFREAWRMLERRISIFVALPLDKIERLALQRRLKEIGGLEGATDRARRDAGA